MGPQIWHQGIAQNHHSGWLPSTPFEGPSGLNNPDFKNGNTMTESDIDDTLQAADDAFKLLKAAGPLEPVAKLEFMHSLVD